MNLLLRLKGLWQWEHFHKYWTIPLNKTDVFFLFVIQTLTVESTLWTVLVAILCEQGKTRKHDLLIRHAWDFLRAIREQTDGCCYRFEGLVSAGLWHGEDFELSWHHSGRVLQELEVWLCLLLLFFLLLFILLLLLAFLDLLWQKKNSIFHMSAAVLRLYCSCPCWLCTDVSIVYLPFSFFKSTRPLLYRLDYKTQNMTRFLLWKNAAHPL